MNSPPAAPAPQRVEFIKAMIHYDIDVALFGVSEAQKNLISKDPQAQFALGQFGEAVKLTELAKNRTATSSVKAMRVLPSMLM